MHSLRELSPHYSAMTCNQRVTPLGCSFLDFPNCEFYIEDDEPDKIIPIEINSSEEFIMKWNEFLADEEDFHVIYSRVTKMTTEFYKKELDLFMIDKCNHDWYVSERFVDTYYKNKLTGLEFESVDF